MNGIPDRDNPADSLGACVQVRVWAFSEDQEGTGSNLELDCTIELEDDVRNTFRAVGVYEDEEDGVDDLPTWWPSNAFVFLPFLCDALNGLFRLQVYKVQIKDGGAGPPSLLAAYSNKVSCFELAGSACTLRFTIECNLRGMVFGGVRNVKSLAYVFDFDADDDVLVAACSDGTVRVHRSSDGEELSCIGLPVQAPVSSVRLIQHKASSNLSGFVLVCCGNGKAMLYQLSQQGKQWALKHSWEAHDTTIYDCLQMQDHDDGEKGMRLVTCSGDCNIKFWQGKPTQAACSRTLRLLGASP